MSRHLSLALLLPFAALTGCGSDHPTPTEVAVDPATRLALQVPLLVDPGLDTQSHVFAIISDPAPLEGSLPLDDFAPATAAAARAEALKLSGPPDAASLPQAPCPTCAAPTLALRVAALCKTTFTADLAQAAEMPAELPIYPRAHLREAGKGEGACTLRAASFSTPANAIEALGFYRALAARSGFALQVAKSGTISAIIGKRGGDGARFAVIARPMPGRLSEIDLIVSGL